MEFLGIVKATGNSSPTRYMYGDEDYMSAIQKMCKLVGVTSTADIYEYDLFEVVTGGYRVVAQKIGTKVETRAALPPPPKDVGEGTYTPYSVMRQH